MFPTTGRRSTVRNAAEVTPLITRSDGRRVHPSRQKDNGRQAKAQPISSLTHSETHSQFALSYILGPMQNIVCKLCLLNVMLLSLLCHTATAQEDSRNVQEKGAIDPKNTTRLELASNIGPPGAVVVIPIYFTPAQGVEVGSLKLEVHFVSAFLKFEKFEGGPAAKMGNVDLSSNVKVGKNEQGMEVSTLTVLASFLSSELPKNGIPAGILGYLTMRLSEKAPPAAVIRLRTVAEGTELGSNKPLQNLRTSDGNVEVFWVDAPPSVNCFFFSH